MERIKSVQIYSLITIVCLLYGCAVKIQQPEISMMESDYIRNKEVPKNKGRIVFYSGKMLGAQMNRAAVVYIENTKIGTIGNKEELIVVDLFPGRYSFKWNVPMEDMDYSYTQPAINEVDVNSEQTLYFTANFLDNTSREAKIASYIFGPVVTLASMKFITVFEQDSKANGKNALNSHKIVLYEKNFSANFSSNSNDKILKQNLNGTNDESLALENLKNTNSEVKMKLEDLKNLYDNDLITKEEYDEKRKEIIEKY